MSDRRSRTARARTLGALFVAITGVSLLLGGAGGAGAVGGPTFWKVDLHEHSSFSGDARADIGIDAAVAKSRGYNAVFLTDHDRLSGFQIQGANGNFLSYTDTLSGRWTGKSAPTPTLPAGSLVTNAVTTSRFHSGTSSLHLAATAGTPTNVRSYVYADRGVGLSSGIPTLDFWVYPQTIDAGSGADVSVSLGGDQSTGVSTWGYTTADGIAHPGKSTVIVWQLGSARASSSNGTTDVYSNSLDFTAGTWNHYTINILTGAGSWTPNGGSTIPISSTGVNGLGADKPDAHDVLAQVKMEASAVSGTADAYFDDYTLSVSNPQCSAADFVYRNGLIDSGQFNTSTFKLFPGREMGQNNHSNQFNFDITSAGAYDDTYSDGVQDDQALCGSHPSAAWKFNYHGTDNIPGVQASGYPAQDNHPGVTDKTTDVVSTLAHGADAVEVRTGGDYSATWDAILQQNHPIVGTYGSDAHTGVANGAAASFIDAPSLALNDLLHSLFEGRLFMAPNTFTGQIVFNLDGGPSPYPARYPVYVPAGQTSASASLAISGGLVAGEKIAWIYSNNGGADQTITDTVSGSSYSATKTIPLTGAFTYVRAAVLSSSGALLANTEPIFFEDVSGMTAGTSARVDSITAPSGTCSCTVAMTKGITAATWTTGSSKLGITLSDPAGSAVELRVPTTTAPLSVTVDGSSVPASGSLSGYQSASGSAWFYDAAAKLLYVRDRQAAGTSAVAVFFGVAATPPTVPQNLQAAAVGSSEIDLSWSASSDPGGPGLAGYNVYRDGLEVASVTAGTSFADTGLAASSTHSYKVAAFDSASNESALSASASATTASGGGGGGAVTLNPVADAYVVAGSSSNYGRATTLRVDSLPSTSSFLRFGVAGVSGPVSSVVLKVWANSNLAAGYSVDRVADDSWGETTVTAANAPSVGSQIGSSGSVSSGGYTSIVLDPSFVSGNGDVDLALVARSSTALSLASRESATPPQLVVTSSGGGGGGDTTAPSVPQNLAASAAGSSEIDLSWSASSDNAGGSGVSGYKVYRDGGAAAVATVTAGTFADTGLAASATHSYTVAAFDAASNESGQSASASATTASGGGGGSVVLPPVADAYVSAASASTNYGKATTLRVDGSPLTSSFLRFGVAGVSGPVSSVVLKVWANSNLAAGYSVDRVADDSWGETTITAANAPAVGSQIGLSGPVSSGGYTSIVLDPSFVSGNGDVDLALLATSSTALSLASRESANPPQLVITVS
jgi:chitodextrinase